ncbi:hypothetical protein [Streptomyces sp. ISL-100]|uniref:hypothetical protein n=1 Tax=Streptomyces sp. ISL-100 TaxID=2819173 RepID=UPI001BEA51BB|nr:hypothetical protein [Streptomyces sp. ISL-100]MBT2399230.1 hypothetical protein [Streptomyces sp. ISL-100]
MTGWTESARHALYTVAAPAFAVVFPSAALNTGEARELIFSLIVFGGTRDPPPDPPTGPPGMLRT